MSFPAYALQSKSYNEDYYREHVAANLDYAVYGEWQRDYGRWLVESLDWRGAAVLDVGCACGSIANGLFAAGAGPNVCGVDLCEHMVRLGREKFPKLRLEVCDAVWLHHFHDGDFDVLHSACVAEHWRPELVPFILRELHRVSKPATGTFYVSLDTEEVYARQGRKDETEDATHICIRPQSWWFDRFRDAGWKPMREDRVESLRQHANWTKRPNGEEGFKRFDWDFFVFERVS